MCERLLQCTKKEDPLIKPYSKIAIFGNAGSGKTTLALQLKDALNLPLYHLDQYYWLPNWERGNLEEFKVVHNDLCENDIWIMEGSYYKLLPKRILHADVVIFLDMPRYLCVWHILKRAVLHFDKVIPGNPAQCKQHLFNFKFLEFLRWVWNFNNRNRPMINAILEEFKDTKQIYVLRSPLEIESFVEKLLVNVQSVNKFS